MPTFAEIFGNERGSRSLAERWKHEELFDSGFVAVPNVFLRHYAHLKPHRLTFGEALFVLHLMEFKWDANAPFPGYSTLAKRMGISDKMARRHAQSLEAKKYLKRQIRIGQTNRFDLSPLFDALLRVARAERSAMAATSAKTTANEAWVNHVLEAYGTLSVEDKATLDAWKSADTERTILGWPGWERLIGKRPR